jgi:1-deoxy-D-xylulose-5-phosphate reductoisomerase
MSEKAKRIVILGSTGSIGVSTLEVVGMLRGRVEIVGLAAGRNVKLLNRQIAEHRPEVVAVGDPERAAGVDRSGGPQGLRVEAGEQAIVDLAALDQADLVVNALVGAAGIRPTLAAIEAGKPVAIANKESLVAAGELISREARRAGVRLVPVDSEHSAIYQCLKGEPGESVSRIILTASGGPLKDLSAERMGRVTASEALDHPTWSMGRKVTIDSATLLNKGFEVMEARWLFGIEADRIEVVVERKSIVHSMVEFVDGTLLALMSPPDMRLPIQYALTGPDRVATPLPRLDPLDLGGLEFERPDVDRFPCLGLAYESLRRGGTATTVLSAADEVVVDAFLRGRVGFHDIHRVLREVLDAHRPGPAEDLESILAADGWARRETEFRVAGPGKGGSS